MSQPHPDPLLAARAAAKAESRRQDRADLAAGVPADEIQQRNSIVPADFIRKARIRNLATAIGH